MPRTVWRSSSPPSSNPEFNSPAHFRGCALETHHDPLQSDFGIPLYINSGSTDSERCLVFRDYGRRNVARRLSRLNPDDCRAFCWKDCAIYGNAGVMASDHSELWRQVYREWYPHRAEDKDVSDGSFFGKFMRFIPPVERLTQILRFHNVLCEKLQSLEEDIEDKPPPYAIRQDRPRRVGAFKLRETFSLVFIVLEAGWQEHGVLLVWKNGDVAKLYGCREGGEIMGYHGSDAGDLGEACVFHCPLKRAMQIVVSQDPERAQKRTEYNELLEETLGDQDDT